MLQKEKVLAIKCDQIISELRKRFNKPIPKTNFLTAMSYFKRPDCDNSRSSYYKKIQKTKSKFVSVCVKNIKGIKICTHTTNVKYSAL